MEDKIFIEKTGEELRKGAQFLFAVCHGKDKEHDSKFGRPLFENQLSYNILLKIVENCLNILKEYEIKNSIDNSIKTDFYQNHYKQLIEKFDNHPNNEDLSEEEKFWKDMYYMCGIPQEKQKFKEWNKILNKKLTQNHS